VRVLVWRAAYLQALGCFGTGMSNTDQPDPVRPFIAVYALHSPLGSDTGEVYTSQSVSVQVVNGPFTVSTTQAVRVLEGGAKSLEMRMRPVQFPEGRFLIIQSNVHDRSKGRLYDQGSTETSVAAAKMGILFPGPLSERQFAGIVNTPGHYFLSAPAPLEVNPRPDEDPDNVRRDLHSMDTALSAQPAEIQDRFKLAARWY